MSRLYKSVTVERDQLASVTCDRCGKIVEPEDILEWQEFMCWRNVAGYASVWGDGTKVSVDLCQQCTHDLFAEFAVVR